VTIRKLRPLRLIWFSLLTILAVLFVLPALSSRDGILAAQNSDKPYALIFGTVWGPDDRPVYGVTVRIRRASDKPKKVRWEVYSDHRGEFAQRVPAGESEYILTADLKHFKSPDGKPLHLLQEVTVHVYNDEREDTGLHLSH
jgi:hypothetical protein